MFVEFVPRFFFPLGRFRLFFLISSKRFEIFDGNKKVILVFTQRVGYGFSFGIQFSDFAEADVKLTFDLPVYRASLRMEHVKRDENEQNRGCSHDGLE